MNFPPLFSSSNRQLPILIYFPFYFYFYFSMTTSTMDEHSQWNEACSWVQEQVIISFRHRTISSRLNAFPMDKHAERTLPPCMLVIELPPQLRTEETIQHDIDQGSVAQLKDSVVAWLKHLEDMESIEEQVRMQREQRSKLCKLRKLPASIKNVNTSSKTSGKRRSSSA